MTPLLVPAIADENALANGLAQIREGLESRKQLADYGAIRYMHPSPDIRSAVTVDFRREILFNYLGETKTSSSITPLFLAMTPFLDMPASQGPVYGLEVNAWMEAGVLIVEWTVPDTSSAMAAAKTAASALNDRLMSVCRAVRTQTRTAADFPHANLDQRGLAKLSEVLERLGP